MSKSKKTILIAEDDPLVRKATVHYLQTKGYATIETDNGSEALHIFRAKKPNLILTDLRMPKLDGMQLVKIITVEAPEIPVIIFSGMGKMIDVIEALRAGAWDYITKPIQDLEILAHSINRALERARFLHQEKERQAYLEHEVEKRTRELVQQNRQLEREMVKRQAQEALVLQAKQEWERTIDALPDMIAIVDKQHRIVRVNQTMLKVLGTTYDEFLGTKCHICAHCSDSPPDYCPHSQLLLDQQEHRVEIFEKRLGGHCEIIVLPYNDPDGTLIGSVHVVRDINKQKSDARDKEKLHSQLLHAQKLESVGQLAAGIAHEINTPTQFIGSNIDFLADVFKDIASMVATVLDSVDDLPSDSAKKIRDSIEEADWEYLAEEIPKAINQSQEGVSRVTSIVRAMKEFSHPGTKAKVLADLNHIIETTITVARNEWKYVADIKTFLDTEIPHVPCLVDEMGQVFLNILVNAAHAIGKKLGDNPEGEKGTIHFRTRCADDFVEIQISDTGSGIPKNIEEKIFDPFFTTKAIGKGTGQGLTIARDVIIEKHQGSISVSSEPDKGTTFTITLPLREEEEGGNG